MIAMLPNLGPMEMMVVMLVAVLLFGKRLPEVGRSLGKGIVEFKKGMRGLGDDFDDAPARSKSYEPYRPSEASPVTVPKFEPPTTPPVPQESTTAETYQD